MQKVTFGDSLPGLETGDKTLPAIIVVQEWWGVSPNIVGMLSIAQSPCATLLTSHRLPEPAELATQIASHGFRVLIPDLYKGKIGVDAEEASHLMGALDFKGACKEIASAASYLLATGSSKVGITGFCMGGALTLASMAEGAEVVAGAPFYGIPDARYFDVTKITKPVLFQSGEKDNMKGFSDPVSVNALEEKMKSAGGLIDLHIYPSGGHGFMNILTSVGEEYLAKVGQPIPVKAEAELALERLVKFFTTHLSVHMAPLNEEAEE